MANVGPGDERRLGDYWNGEKWATSKQDEEFFYDCLRRSYKNLRYTMNPDRRVWDPRCRNHRVDADRAWRETSPDADLWGLGEAPPAYYDEYP